MYKKFTPFLLVSFFAACTPGIRYIGQSLPKTDKIDVYISDQSIKRPYELIGKGYLVNFYPHNQNKIQEKAESIGKEKGADAVLITEYFIANTGGTSITSVNRTDSVGNGTIQTGTTVIAPTTQSGFNIFYIKYSK